MFFAYVYCGFTFLSNDILTLSLALVRFPFRKAFIAIFLGNTTLMVIIAYLAKGGISVFN